MDNIELREFIFKNGSNPFAIARCGSFVGLYRYSNIYQHFELKKKLNKEDYGFRPYISVPDATSKENKETTSPWRIRWGVNEFYLVPKGYDMRKKSHIDLLYLAFNERIKDWHRSTGANRALECIQMQNPNPKTSFLGGNIVWQ